jgi:hypothetical protein
VSREISPRTPTLEQRALVLARDLARSRPSRTAFRYPRIGQANRHGQGSKTVKLGLSRRRGSGA